MKEIFYNLSGLEPWELANSEEKLLSMVIRSHLFNPNKELKKAYIVKAIVEGKIFSYKRSLSEDILYNLERYRNRGAK